MLRDLAQYLVDQRLAGRMVLLVIDEAQNLSLPALEEIRMLSNLETEKSKLIQIIMIGQPELREKLALPQLQQLRQRITVSYHLQPLDCGETAAYINHRLRRAALGPAIEFPRDVTDLIHTRSRGVPRIINVIADATLLFAYGVDRRDVDVGITADALAELDATGVLASYHSEGTPAAGAARMLAETEEALRAAEDVRRREQALVAKERQLAQREQQVAVRQRVVEEEARILAAARKRSSNAVAAGESPVAVSADAAGAGSPSAGAGADAAGAGATAVASGAEAAGVTVNRAAASPVRAAVAPASSAVAPAARSGAAAASRTGIESPGSTVPATMRSGLPPRSVAAPASGPVAAPRSPAATSKVFSTRHTGVSVTPSGVRVQRYEHALATREPGGFWERLRRLLFGITEPETGA